MQPKSKSQANPKSRPTPGSLYTHPAASIFTGKVDNKLPEMDSLPFIKRRPKKGSGFHYWAVKPSGDYAQDCDTGCAYAQMLLPFLKYNLGITMLGRIVLDMIEDGPDKNGTGLVVGFMGELSRELSSARASLAFFAAAAAKPSTLLPRRLKGGQRTIRRAAAETAIPTLKRLGSVI
jgi:hypothetical protein